MRLAHTLARERDSPGRDMALKLGLHSLEGFAPDRRADRLGDVVIGYSISRNIVLAQPLHDKRADSGTAQLAKNVVIGAAGVAF